MIIALTATHGRDLGNLARYLRRQTLPVDQWIIVSDSDSGIPLEVSDLQALNVKMINREPRVSDRKHTMLENLVVGLANCPRGEGDLIFFFEDDDWYGERWVEEVVARAARNRKAAVFGESEAIYYHLGKRMWRECGNLDHASLCSTVIRGSFVGTAIPMALTGDSYGYDMRLWAHANLRGVGWLINTVNITGNTVVGIKGQSDRHTVDGRWVADSEGMKLRELVGEEDTLLLVRNLIS